MTIPTSNLASLLVHTARHFGERPGLIQGDRAWTWSALEERVRRAANALAARGVRHGDRVLVHSRNCNALFESMWACWRIGAVWVPTNFRLTPPEVAYLAQSSRATAHIFDTGFPDHAAAARDANSAAHLFLGIGDGESETWETLVSEIGAPELEVADVDRDDVCWFFYTSGTTGRPKAAMLTHGQMAFVTVNHLCDLMPDTTEEDVSLVVAPLSHGAGIHAITQVARGAASVLLETERFDCEEAWALVEKHCVSNMFTVPTILTMLTTHPAVDRFNHSSLRYVIYAGAPMYRADQQHALRKLGNVLVQYFGLGEVTGNITVLPPRMHSVEDDPCYPIGSCGFPRTGIDIAILSGDGNRLQANETGEICVRGPAVFAGYFENDEANEKAFAKGWFHTGDLGHFDRRGFLYITGRASDMYISGGSNVYPREVEELLLTHGAVAEACVVGVPHEKWGEAGVAVLVASPGSAVDAAVIMHYLDGKLSRYKLPSRILFWEALPKSGYGKVAKAEVKRLLEAYRDCDVA
jgi:acyl-CoA synthetase (AMP-forming)/AMP-acid ligase II